MIKAAAFITLCLSLVCSLSFAGDSEESADHAAKDSSSVSRLRLFGQNGAMAKLFRGSSCVKGFWDSDGEKVSGSMSGAFSSFIGTASNTSLGIAETETSRNLSKKDGLMSKAYFREYEIPADQPSSMRMGFQDVSSLAHGMPGFSFGSSSRSCHGAISFTPRAGQDYEAGFTWDDKACYLSVSRVETKEGKTELIPVPVEPAPDC